MKFSFYEFFFKRKDTLIFILLITISLLFLIFYSKESKQRVDKFGYTISTTFQKVFFSTGSFFSETFRSISELRKLKVEYNSLKKHFEESKRLNMSIEALNAEIKRLNDQLGFSNQIVFEHVAAKIIAKDPGYNFFNITIGVGSIKGVQKDMPVIAYLDGKYGLVGKISEVTPFSSHVVPLYSPECFVAARLEFLRNDGLVSGLGYTQDFINMSYVSKLVNNKIKIGDLVITSGMQSIYPYGIPIGIVEKISSKNWESSITLTLRPILDFSKLEYVYVLKENKELINE